MPGFALVILSLGFMLFRVVSPRGVTVQGRILRTVTLNFRERLQLQRTNMLCLGVILLLGGLGHWVPLPFELLAIVASYGVLMVPVRYQITSHGIGLNRVIFRRWDEFAEIEASSQRIVLRGRPGNGRLTIWLRDVHQADVLSLLRRYVHGANRASARIHPEPAERTNDKKGGSKTEQIRFA